MKMHLSWVVMTDMGAGTGMALVSNLWKMKRPTRRDSMIVDGSKKR